ncbi:MAG: RNA polymerase sigma factor [Acidobacteriota bacterium]
MSSVSMDEDNQREEKVQLAAEAAVPEAVPAAVADLEQVFQAHHGRVFRAAYRVTGNAGDAEDVLQTVFLRLLDRHATEPIADMPSYLHRAAVNAALDLLRTRQRSHSLPLEEVAPRLVQDARLQPDRRLAARELRESLRQAIARLSPKAAEIFALRYFEGYEYAEIASMLGLTLSNVAVTLHRSRGQLQEELRSFIGGHHEH